MKTTDIATKEYDIEITYGMFNLRDQPREAAFASVKYMYTDLTDIRKYYMRLGFHLDEFARQKFFEDFGFLNLEEFSEKNLGMDKSAVSRCINVYRTFNASTQVSYRNGIKTMGCAMDLAEEWKDYSYTQLCEMLPLSQEQRKQISPDMSVKQIREYKKGLKSDGKTPIDSLNELVASTQPEDTEHDPVASTQLFDFNEYEIKKGIVLYNYIKKCDSIENGRLKYLYIFDDRGKEIAVELQCDILFNDDNDIVIRLYNPSKPLEWDED